MNKGIQFFSKEYLSRCKGATPDQILEFLEHYRMLFSLNPEFLKAQERKAVKQSNWPTR